MGRWEGGMGSSKYKQVRITYIAKGVTHLVNRNVEGWIAHGIHGDYVITMVLHLVMSCVKGRQRMI